ncbi:hypothetical protein JCM8547_002212 [Rhodosporidiobolus lusitaniae]
MSAWARLSVADIAHRVTVSGLAALSVYGMYGMWRVHTETMEAGRKVEAEWAAAEALKQRESTDPLLKGFVDPPPQRPS